MPEYSMRLQRAGQGDWLDGWLERWIDRLPPWVLAAVGGWRRRRGRYDPTTLRLFERAAQRAPGRGHRLRLARFRRDLGLVPDSLLLAELARYPLRGGATATRRLVSLLLESDRLDADAQALRRTLLPLAGSSPPLAHWLTEHGIDLPPRPKALARIEACQAQWRDEFTALLRQHAGAIAVVGNAAKLRGTGLGEAIDRAAMVVRFNRYASAHTRVQDQGARLDVWVCAPGFLHTAADPGPGTARWLVVSGPDMRYQLVDWGPLELVLAQGIKVLTVPLPVWGELVEELQAPPSAGLLSLAWARELLGGVAGLQVAGFGHDGLLSTAYHRARPGQRAGGRHNWPGECAILWRWIDEGLVILERQ